MTTATATTLRVEQLRHNGFTYYRLTFYCEPIMHCQADQTFNYLPHTYLVYPPGFGFSDDDINRGHWTILNYRNMKRVYTNSYRAAKDVAFADHERMHATT